MKSPYRIYFLFPYHYLGRSGINPKAGCDGKEEVF